MCTTHLVHEGRLKSGLVDEQCAAMACSSQTPAWPCVAAVDKAPAAHMLKDKRPCISAVLHQHRLPPPQTCTVTDGDECKSHATGMRLPARLCIGRVSSGGMVAAQI